MLHVGPLCIQFYRRVRAWEHGVRVTRFVFAIEVWRS